MTAAAPFSVDIAAFDFAVLRTPLLPFDELAGWGAGLEAPAAGDDPAALAAAVDRDRELLRTRLRRLAERPEVREALFLASPSLVEGLARWRRAPDDKKGRRAEDALVRYLTRMSSRPTPFGMFSGCSVAEIGEPTRFELAPRGDYRRRSRLDMDYLFRLQEDLGRDRALRRALRYRPNTSLFRAAGRLRYAESRLRGEMHSYHLVAVDPDPFVDAVLRAAADGATVAELTRVLVATDPDGEVETEEAEEFVHELIDNQLLVSALAPVVTGADAAAELAAQLREAGEAGPVADRLDEVSATLAAFDREAPGTPPRAYRAIGDRLAELPTEVKRSRLFQVDMIKPVAAARLGPEIVEEIARGVALLYALGGRTTNDEALDRFRRDFMERYESDRPVPLLEALDEESGIGFERDRGADVSPLLEGLALPAAPDAAARLGWSAADQRLANRLGRALDRGDTELELTEADLADLVSAGDPPLSDTFAAMATVAAASAEALAAGEVRVLLRGVFGPTGARLLTRFCHADPELESRVRELVAAEEALEPEAVFAEVVHLPEGRIGNIVSRPLLREWEIPFLGRSGAPPERRIPVTDLLVTVSGGEIVLRSARDGRRVIPRLTTAHNFSAQGLGLYRFLAALQMQGTRSGLAWRWGPLEALAYLPRVTSGRVVLARAQWGIAADEIAELDRPADGERYAAVRDWRRRRGVPRWVVLPDGDHELVVDLDNPLSIDAFLSLVRDRPRAHLMELYPGPDELCVGGPEGRFTHELLVPFARRREPTRRTPPPLPRGRGWQRFAPGSEWLYARLYTGTSTSDRVLRQVVPRVVHPALGTGAADRWFFIRYGDPAPHLRLRLHGDPRRLWGGVLPALEDAVAPLLADGQVWKLELGTYEPELERYGGPAGLVLAERLFQADSEAVVEILDLLEGDASADLVWRLALVGIDRLFADLGLEGDEALGVLGIVQELFAREHRVDTRVKKQLSARLRREQAELERLLEAGDDPSHPLAPALAAFGRRSEALAPVVAELDAGIAAGRVELSLAQLAPSYSHMFVNRLVRSDARAHEMVLYDFLVRLRHSRRMRARALAGSGR